MDPEFVLAEIRRTAEANGGKPLGRSRFEAETGIREHDWRGRYWARWSDAVREAGFEPNELQGRYSDDELLLKLVSEIRRLGRIPTAAEMNLRRRVDEAFPNPKVFDRLGPKRGWPSRIAAFCAGRAEWADVSAIVGPLGSDVAPGGTAEAAASWGFVYLLKSGRHYKIGRTVDPGRRRYDLAIQLPEAVTEEHVIRTDDPGGIERYWHERFKERRTNGEWFDLTRADIAAFKRRKFM